MDRCDSVQKMLAILAEKTKFAKTDIKFKERNICLCKQEKKIKTYSAESHEFWKDLYKIVPKMHRGATGKTLKHMLAKKKLDALLSSAVRYMWFSIEIGWIQQGNERYKHIKHINCLFCR